MPTNQHSNQLCIILIHHTIIFYIIWDQLTGSNYLMSIVIDDLWINVTALLSQCACPSNTPSMARGQCKHISKGVRTKWHCAKAPGLCDLTTCRLCSHDNMVWAPQSNCRLLVIHSKLTCPNSPIDWLILPHLPVDDRTPQARWERRCWWCQEVWAEHLTESCPITLMFSTACIWRAALTWQHQTKETLHYHG